MFDFISSTPQIAGFFIAGNLNIVDTNSIAIKVMLVVKARKIGNLQNGDSGDAAADDDAADDDDADADDGAADDDGFSLCRFHLQIPFPGFFPRFILPVPIWHFASAIPVIVNLILIKLRV